MEKVVISRAMQEFIERYPDVKETALNIVLSNFVQSDSFNKHIEVEELLPEQGWDWLLARAIHQGYEVLEIAYVISSNGVFVKGVEYLYNGKANFTFTGSFDLALKFNKKSHAEFFAEELEAKASAVFI